MGFAEGVRITYSLYCFAFSKVRGEALEQRHHRLAYWIVASSLYHTDFDPYDALAASLSPIQTIFATRKLDLVLQRIAALDRRFLHINHMYDWQNWSADLDFWECIDQTLWSEKPTTPLVRAHLSEEDQDGKLGFLEGFDSISVSLARRRERGLSCIGCGVTRAKGQFGSNLFVL
ncbi:hypothetical protein B0O99DRAFT_601479 [Bisporella sp. PMI_857]|nr:hypothetical protein B0O99DRAFT_601479 [Bisporella sp. PMI_857]